MCISLSGGFEGVSNAMQQQVNLYFHIVRF